MHADYFRCTKIKHNGTNASLSDVCDSFVLFMLLGKKTSQIGNCILCSLSSVGIAHIVQVNQTQNIHFETDMTGEIDMKWFVFFSNRNSVKIRKKIFCMTGFFFFRKKVTQSDDEYKWWLFSMAYVIWWGWLRCWGW